ncbi:hypothetical protein GCM10027167_18250 [Nocardia heshunensis]
MTVPLAGAPVGAGGALEVPAQAASTTAQMITVERLRIACVLMAVHLPVGRFPDMLSQMHR